MTTAYKDADQRRADLVAALAGVELTEREEQLLTWLTDWDQDTTDALATLITKARRTPEEDPR